MPVDRVLAGALLLHLLQPIAVAQQLEVLPRREQQRRATRKTPISDERHISRCRSRSTSRTIGLLRTSFLIAYSKVSAVMSAPPVLTAWLPATSRCARVDSVRSRPRSAPAAAWSACVIASRRLQRPQRVLHDAVLERVERDHHQPSGWREPAGRVREKAVEPLELAIDPDADRLERPRRRVDARVALARDRPPHDVGQPARRLDAPRAPASTIARATRRAWRSSPNS